MALVDLLYLCPDCGAEAMEGKGSEATCAGCGTSFATHGRGQGILVTSADQGSQVVAAHELASGIEAHDSVLKAVRQGTGGVLRRTRVLLSLAVGEGPVRHGDRILGFIEEFGPPDAGELTLTSDGLTFTSEGEELREWRLAELTALQAASSSLQLTQPGRPLASFRFRSDSTRRWESLLREAIRRVWREAGRGEVDEFQPRIRAHGS